MNHYGHFTRALLTGIIAVTMTVLVEVSASVLDVPRAGPEAIDGQFQVFDAEVLGEPRSDFPPALHLRCRKFAMAFASNRRRTVRTMSPNDAPPVAELVQRLKAEFTEAGADFRRRAIA